MAGIREIRSRIKSVENTRQITRAMKMVSVAKLRRAQSGAPGMELYEKKSRELLGRLCGVKSAGNRFLTPRPEVRRVCYVLFVGNRGLCGMYNHAVVRCAQELLAAQTHPAELLVVGRWGRELFEREKLPVRQYMDVDDVPNPADAMRLTKALEELYLTGEADEVYLVYQQYQSVLQQTPTSLRLLPAALPDAQGQAEEYIFEPSPEAVLERLTEAYLYHQVYSAVRQSRIGEQAARMSAMTAASDATTELIGQLNLKLNRARQAAITTEISEIVGGANALHAAQE